MFNIFHMIMALNWIIPYPYFYPFEIDPLLFILVIPSFIQCAALLLDLDKDHAVKIKEK